MSNIASPKKQATTNATWWQKFRLNMAEKLVRFLYGRPMTITPFPKSAVAGSVVFWYFEDGARHFVMVKHPSGNGKARFASCLGLGEYNDITTATKHAVKKLFGSVFYKSLDSDLIAADRVAAVPTFRCEDPANGATVPVNGAVWVVQITPEQAQLCQSELENADIIAIPEMAMHSQEISTSHQMIYQSVLRHVHGTPTLLQSLGVDQLDDMFRDAIASTSGNKTIH